MIYRYFLAVMGDAFFPEKILDKIEGEFFANYYFSPGDEMKDDTNNLPEGRFYNYGCLSFWHPKEAATSEYLCEYDEWFPSFLEKNRALFFENGVTEVDILMGIYFDGGQCNFSAFDKDILKRLSVFDASLPISVYILDEEHLSEWKAEIRSSWKSP